MALLDTIAQNQARSAATAGRSAPSTQARPQAKVWMNVGYNAGDKFINLPLGLAIDTMEPVDAKGQNQEWLQLQAARNELLKALQEEGDKLAPGEEREIPLIVKIRHVADQQTVDPSTNPLSMEAAGFSLSVVK